MRFLMLYKIDRAKEGIPPTPKDLESMQALIDEMSRAGVLLATEGCLPSVKGARVRRSGGDLTVTDGPFAESKEVVAGFALVRAKSKDEAIELAKRFLAVAGEGESEIREVCEQPAFALEER